MPHFLSTSFASNLGNFLHVEPHAGPTVAGATIEALQALFSFHPAAENPAIRIAVGR
jgi:hypothetical protein